jgi:UDP-N-acetylmuramate dehydrogenase
MIVLPETRGEYKYDYNIAPLTWFKVGGHASVLYKPADIDDLSYFLKNYDHKLPIFTLGAGSNIIIRDGGVNGIVIKLGRNFTDIEILDDNRIRAGAGNLNYNLAQFCLQNSIKNFEFLIGIPGTIGGGIAMNAGSYGAEFKDIIEEVKYLDKKGNIHIIKCKDIGFGYRHNNLPEDLDFCRSDFPF